jgi:IS5 family transposase
LRPKINVEPELDFRPSSLKLTNQYYAKYEAISTILDDNREIIDLAHRDLEPARKQTSKKRKRGSGFRYSADTLLRIVICQIIEGLSLRQVVVRIDDSQFLRRFVRIDGGSMMDYTTLSILKNAIGDETWKKMNRLLAAYAAAEGRITGEGLRMDTTAVETNIHWPTDSSLLWDTYRVQARLIERARTLDPEAVGTGRLHTRRAKRAHLAITRKAAKKNRSRESLQPLYKGLIGRVEGISGWAASVAEGLAEGLTCERYDVIDHAIAETLASELQHYRTLGARVIDQARRRILEGESVPNNEKLFSIFEPHTELLKRGKAGKDIEFGHMIQIQQVEEKFITDYAAFFSRPVEHQLVTACLESHHELFGDYPNRLAADKGYYEDMPTLHDLEKKVDVVSIAKKGKRNPEETARENDPLFRHAQAFRAGVEGSISFLKRVLGLTRCLNKGWDHFASTVGATVFSHNLLILARC